MAWDSRYPPAAQLPLGLAGMVAHENRLLSEPTELLDANGLALDDLSGRKEPGASAYDTTGLANAGMYTATLGVSAGWQSWLAAFPGSGLTTQGTPFSAAKATGVSTLAVTAPAVALPVGTLVVMGLGGFTSVPVSANVATAVTDSQGNTWTFLREFASLNNYKNIIGEIGFTQFAYSILTTALQSPDVITITFAGPQADADVVFSGFAGVTGDLVRSSSSAHLSSDSPFGSLSPGQAPYIMLAVTGNILGTSHTPGSGFTESIESNKVATSYRIDTDNSDIVGLFDWYSDVQATGTNTVTTIAGSTTVTGAAPNFDLTLAPGDRIVVNNETRVVQVVNSAGNLTTTTPFISANAAVAWQWRVGNRLITASSEGKIYKEKPSTLTTGNLDTTILKSGLSKSARPGRFVAGGKEVAANNRKLFYFNGVDPVQVLSGNGLSMTAIASPPADWSATADQNKQPINGLIHENHLLAWGNLNDPHRVYASSVDNHEDFLTTPLSLRFRSEIGDRIWCGASFQGVFFVWKYPRGIFYLDDTDLNITNWSVRSKSEALGCAPSPYAALPVDDDVLFMAADGSFHLLTAVDALGGVRASDITRRLGLSKWIRDNLNLARLELVVSAWYPQSKLALFGVPSTNSLINDLTLKFDFSGVDRGLPIKFSYSQRDAPGALAVRRAVTGGPEIPVLGEAGFAYLLQQEARNKNGAAYLGRFQTPHLDFSHIEPTLRWKRKQYEHLELIMEPVTAGTIDVDVYVDGTLAQTLTFDATLRRDKQKLNVGDGYTISVRGSNMAAGEDFKVLSVLVYFKVGNEDQSR